MDKPIELRWKVHGCCGWNEHFRWKSETLVRQSIAGSFDKEDGDELSTDRRTLVAGATSWLGRHFIQERLLLLAADQRARVTSLAAIRSIVLLRID